MPNAFSLEEGWYHDAQCRICGRDVTPLKAMFNQPCKCGFRYHRAFPKTMTFSYP